MAGGSSDEPALPSIWPYQPQERFPMPRLASLDEVLFPIVQEPLFSESDHSRGLRPIPAYNAIVNRESGRVLGVVSRSYGLVTNVQAVELGRRCCRELFGLSEADHLTVLNVDAPSTGTHCHVDLVHPAHAMNLFGAGERPEVYVPYMRVTNSYNGTRALRFDIGLCRKLCLNGVIFERESIQFRYPHVRGEVDVAAIRFRIKDGQIEKLMNQFRRFIVGVREVALGEEESRTVLRQTLGISDESVISHETDARRRLQMLTNLNISNECLGRYRAELGHNAYAVFNAMTELARTLGSKPGMFRDTHSMQKLAGAWLADFHRNADGAATRRAA